MHFFILLSIQYLSRLFCQFRLKKLLVSLYVIHKGIPSLQSMSASAQNVRLLYSHNCGLTPLHSPLQGSCDGLHLPLHSLTLVSLSRVHWSVPHSFSPASHTPLYFFQVVLFGRHSPLHSFLFGWSFSRIHWFPHFIGKPWWCCYVTMDPEMPASQTGSSYYLIYVPKQSTW
jgi:hypothetical protein